MNLKIAKQLMGCIRYGQSRNGVSNRPVKSITITEEDLIKIYGEQKGRCYWSNLPLDVRYNSIKHHPFAISVERVDNDKDYTYENVVLSRRMFNLGRMAFGELEFRQVMETLVKEIKDNTCPVEPYDENLRKLSSKKEPNTLKEFFS